MIKPVPLRPAVPGGFTLDDFAISEEDGTVTCPAGHTRTISTKRYVTFGAVCAGLPATGTMHHRQRRPVPGHPPARTACCAPPAPRPARGEFRQAYPTRAMIERIIAWTATSSGRRIRLRYLGAAKNNAWLHSRSAAINLRTLINAGLTRRNGAWALA